jgi:hypothetical protein
VHIGTDACDHSKQGLESEIPPETQNDPESEVTDGCDPSKKALDKTEVCHKNFDIDANDQTKQGPNQRLVRKTNMHQNQKLQRVVILPQVYQVTVLELK